MIYETQHWKQPLLRMAQRLRAIHKLKQPSDAQLARVEQDVFVGAYSVRKLLDSPAKITDQTRGTKVALAVYKNIAPVTYQNRDNVEILYEMTRRGQETRDVQFVCSRIIHSYVFVMEVGMTGNLEGILFSSDRDRNMRLYGLDIASLVGLFETFGYDDPTSVSWSKDLASPHGGKFIVT
jgi:hypothetical protein